MVDKTHLNWLLSQTTTWEKKLEEVLADPEAPEKKVDKTKETYQFFVNQYNEERDRVSRLERNELDDNLKKENQTHRINLDLQEMEIKRMESDHRITIEQQELDLKADETERRLQVQEDELEIKKNEADNRKKNEREGYLWNLGTKVALVILAVAAEATGHLIPYDKARIFKW